MNNPFQLIDARLNSLENLLVELKHETIPKLLAQLEIERSENDSFLSKKQAADLWGCSTSTIDNYARRGVLKRHYIGSSVRFKRSEVLQVIEDLNRD